MLAVSCIRSKKITNLHLGNEVVAPCGKLGTVRLRTSNKKIGKELDSLTDVISFGVAPSFIMYFWALNEIGKFGWMFVLIYTVCCALRLARFNLTVIEENETWKINFFEGVPSPAAAGLVLLPLILNLSGIIQFENYALLSSIAILLTSIFEEQY